MVQSIFLLESQTLIKNDKLKEIMKLICLKNFDKVYDILMTNYDLEEEFKDTLAQMIFNLDYLHLISSLVFLF